MPSSVVKTKKDERLWARAKQIAAKANRADDYAYIMGIYKNMIGKSNPVDVPEDGSNIGGVKLTGNDGKWALVHRSSKNPGKWQATYFSSPKPGKDEIFPDTQHGSHMEAVLSVEDYGFGVEGIIPKSSFWMKLMKARIHVSQQSSSTIAKAGPYIGPRGGQWADADHTIPYKPGAGDQPKTETTEQPQDQKTRDEAKTKEFWNQEAARLKKQLAMGSLSGVQQIMGVLGGGHIAALALSPLTALFHHSSAKNRLEAAKQLDRLREKVKSEREAATTDSKDKPQQETQEANSKPQRPDKPDQSKKERKESQESEKETNEDKSLKQKEKQQSKQNEPKESTKKPNRPETKDKTDNIIADADRAISESKRQQEKSKEDRERRRKKRASQKPVKPVNLDL